MPSLSDLVTAARDAASRAHAPYSGLPVGAALRTRSGRVFTGCNVENESYGLTICAERTAAVKAVSEGERDFESVVIYAPRRAFASPCGACRQFLAEFSPNMKVVLANRAGRTRTYSLAQLLPHRFALRI